MDSTSLKDLHSKLAGKPSYVGLPRAIPGLCWKAINREHVLVKDQSADPLLDPVQLVIVAQVSRAGANLKPLGSYSPKFDNLAKSKITFELEMPTDGLFAGDYLRAVTLLRRLEKNALPTLESRNLLVDSTAHSHVRLVAPLFRQKTDDDDEEDIPEGPISETPDDEMYFPTSSNWPMAPAEQDTVASLQATHVFQPMHVVDITDKYVDPTSFAKRLPGTLVQVFFTLRYWSFKSQNFNSFSAQVDHVVVIREAVRSLVPVLAKRKAQRVKADLSAGVKATTKRPGDATSNGQEKRARTGDIQDVPEAVGPPAVSRGGPTGNSAYNQKDPLTDETTVSGEPTIPTNAVTIAEAGGGNVDSATHPGGSLQKSPQEGEQAVGLEGIEAGPSNRVAGVQELQLAPSVGESSTASSGGSASSETPVAEASPLPVGRGKGKRVSARG